MVSKFAVGDRVAAYLTMIGLGSRFLATVVEINKDNVLIDIGRGFKQWVHYKQCHKLVKKKAEYIWVSEGKNLVLFDPPSVFFTSTHGKFYKYKKVRE